MKYCNPLLKSWNDHIRAAAKFVAFRREGRAFVIRKHGVTPILSKKGRR